MSPGTSHLVPERRPDRNGVLVTRHVRAQPPAAAVKASIPAATLPEVPKDTRQAVLDALRSHPHVPAQGRVLIERSVMYLDTRHVAALAEILPDLDERGAKSLFQDFNAYTTAAPAAAHHLAAAVGAYRMARDADDAVLPGDYHRGLVDRDSLLMFVKRFFHDRNGSVFTVTEEDTADVRAAYLLDRCGLGPQEFGTTGRYYRALKRVNDEYERIRPRLPLLIAAHTAYDGQTDWYFGDGDYYFWAFLEEVAEYPVDRIVPIAVETLRRGEFDAGVASQIAAGGSDALTEGVL